MSPLDTFNIHELPVQAHPGHQDLLRARLLELIPEDSVLSLLNAHRLTPIKVQAWLGNPNTYRHFLSHYEGHLLQLIYPKPWPALLWLPFSVGLMLSESFIDPQTDWFPLTTGPEGKTIASIIKKISLWRQSNPRTSLPHLSPSMNMTDISLFGASIVMAYSQAEHPLLPVVMRHKLKPQITEEITQCRHKVIPTPETKPLIQRAIADYFKLKIHAP